eukprot:155319-Pelagomonas_calceolata.AAC.2
MLALSTQRFCCPQEIMACRPTFLCVQTSRHPKPLPSTRRALAKTMCPVPWQHMANASDSLGDPLDLALDDVIGEAHQVHGMTSPTPFAPLVQQSCPGTPGDHPAVGHGDDQAFATHLLDQLQVSTVGLQAYLSDAPAYR